MKERGDISYSPHSRFDIISKDKRKRRTMMFAEIQEGQLHSRDKEILQIALLAGSILTSSSAETYRVEDTMERILALSEHQEVDVLSLLTALVVTITFEDKSYLTASRRIKSRFFDLYKIQRVNEISRALTANRMTLDEAYMDLILLSTQEKKNVYTNLMNFPFAWGFCMMGGGNILESFLAGLAAFLTVSVDFLLPKTIDQTFTPAFFKTMIASFFLAFFSKIIPSVRMDPMILGSLIMLFPGTTFTNGIRDMMKGDYLTAGGNLLSALATALALAFGAGFSLLLIDWIF